MEFVCQILMKLETSSNEGLLMKVFSHSLMWWSKHCSGHYVTTQACTLISWGCVHLWWCGSLQDYTLWMPEDAWCDTVQVPRSAQSCDDGDTMKQNTICAGHWETLHRRQKGCQVHLKHTYSFNPQRLLRVASDVFFWDLAKYELVV